MRMEVFFLFILLMKYSIGNMDGCIISTQPKDTVVLLNENATFTCTVDTQMNDGSYIVFYIPNGPILTSLGSNSELQGKGITWIPTGTGQFKIQVLGSEQNNGLRIKCGFPNCFTYEGKLIVVNALPSPPEPPSITVTNLRTLNITWSSPWQYPVSNYTLSITNQGTGYTENVTLSSNSYLYSMNSLSSSVECDVYMFRVLADTDIGLSGFSNDSKPAGFPKNLSNHQELFIDVSTAMCLASGYMTYNVTATTPTVCAEYETLSYEILASYLKGDINTQDTSIDVILPDTTEPKGLFYIEHDTSSDVVFNITVIATNEAEQSLTSYSIINSSGITKTVVNGEDYVLQPKTIVGLIGTTVTFTCSNTNTDDNPTHLEVNKTRVTNQNSNTDHFNNNGITWEKIPDEPTLISYNVYMNVTEKLNGTSVRCFIPCPSDTAYLIVVSSLPEPSDPPSVVSIHNATLDSLLVSWSPPWPYPVNYYIVFVRFGSSEETILNYTTTLTSYELMKQSSQYNFTTCEVLYVSIEGSTDVGETGRSNETEYGFIKGVQGINTSHLQAMPKSYSISKYNNGTAELHAVTIQMETPDLNLCSYEDVRLSIAILNTVTQVSVTAEVTSSISSSATVNLGYLIQDNDSLEGILTVSDEANQNLSLIIFEAITVDKNDQILASSAVNSATMTSISGISPSNPVSNNDRPVKSTGVPIATIAGASVSGLIVILIIVLVIGGMVYCVFAGKRRRINGDLALPDMVLNDNYCNPQEVLYDSVLTLKELKKPVSNGPSNGTSPTTPITPISAADAPLLPPPRGKAAADQESYSQILPLSKRRNMPPLEPLMLEEADYIPMKANPIGNGRNNSTNNNLAVSTDTVGNGNASTGGVQMAVSPRYIEAPIHSSFSNGTPPLNITTSSTGATTGTGTNSIPDLAVYATLGPGNPSTAN